VSTVYAKYTEAGKTKRRDALANKTALKIGYFRVSDTFIDLTEDIVDLQNYWIEKPITAHQKIESDRLELDCIVTESESSHNGKSYCLYLDDGTPYIVGIPPNFFNAGVEQQYIIQIEFEGSNSNELEFIHVPLNFEASQEVQDLTLLDTSLSMGLQQIEISRQLGLVKHKIGVK